MKPIPVLGIPHYNRPELLARCIASIDYPVTKLVLVFQGPDHNMLSLGDITAGDFHLKAGPLIGEIIIVRHPNAGVAGAWNEIIKLFPAPWWLISNNDIQFAPGDLAKMAGAVEADSQSQSIQAGIFYGNHGASYFALTQDGVTIAGLFDENIFPAYLEDCDMSRRMDLLGVRRENVQGCTAVHGDGRGGSCTVNADPMIQRNNIRTHAGNFEYYKAKWGGVNGEEKFSTPFNDPHWPIDFWRYDPSRRARQSW